MNESESHIPEIQASRSEVNSMSFYFTPLYVFVSVCMHKREVVSVFFVCLINISMLS